MVQLELDPKVERQLIEAAQARGLRPETYASQLVASAVSPMPEKHISKEEMDRFLSGMAKLGKDAPALSDYAYTRESFYEDHD